MTDTSGQPPKTASATTSAPTTSAPATSAPASATSAPTPATAPALTIALRLLLSLVLLLGACGETPGDVLPDPRDGRSGIRFSGLLNDSQVAVSDGLPEVNFGDCDINQGSDRDVCIITEDVNGDLVVIVFENPDVLVEGTTIAIGDTPCADAQACDDVTETALVDIQVGTGPRVRAVSGNLTLEVVVPLSRYRGEFDLRLPDDGTLNATFDLVPRPEEISGIVESSVF